MELSALSTERNLAGAAVHYFHVKSVLQSVELYLLSVPTPPCCANNQLNFSKIVTIRQQSTKSSMHLAMPFIKIYKVWSLWTVKLTVACLMCVHSFDFDRQIIKLSFKTPRVTLNGRYDIGGRIFGLPMYGQGDYQLVFGAYGYLVFRHRRLSDQGISVRFASAGHKYKKQTHVHNTHTHVHNAHTCTQRTHMYTTHTHVHNAHIHTQM